MVLERSIVCVISLVLLCLDFRAAVSDDTPTPEDYVARVGGNAVILTAGQFQIDGRTTAMRHASRRR
jgi:hypothetical protein